MAVGVISFVLCDSCDDGEGPPVMGPSVDRPGARKAARDEGWDHNQGKDVCPACVQREAWWLRMLR
jgi:hypothetical protein